MTEKVGHKELLRVMRKEWIDETKPGRQTGEVIDLDDDELQILGGEEEGQETNVENQEKSVGKVALEDEPLFVDEDSDFDLHEISGSQNDGEKSDDVQNVGSQERNKGNTVSLEDGPLFVDDDSDFDMNEIFGSQNDDEKSDNVQVDDKNEGQATEENLFTEFDDFEDEMNAMRDLDEL